MSMPYWVTILLSPTVASSYEKLWSMLGVAISKDKSLISSTGCLEFANEFLVKSLQKHLSPISLRCLLTVRSTLGILQLGSLYGVSNPNTLFRLAGAGFRTRSRLDSFRRSRRWERLWVVATKPGHGAQLPRQWWIGRGKPLNPYLKGLLVEWLRKETKEIRLIPDELLFDGEREILERTLI